MEPRLSQLNFTSIASGDFTNIATNNAADGVYTLNGVPCAIGDIIDVSHPDGYFDPLVDIDGEGLKARDLGGESYNGLILEMKEPLLSTLLDGFTVVLDCLTGPAAPDGGATMSMHDVPFNVNPVADARLNETVLYALDESDYYNNTDYLILPSQINKIAFTLTEDRMAVSINGMTAHAVESGCLGGGVTNVSIQTRAGPANRLRSFAFYEVVDDGDLPTLSTLA